MTNLIDQILFAANEDYSGLWEIFEETKDLHKEFSKEDLIKLAKLTLLELIERGWIRLYWCREPLTNDRVSPIELSEVQRVLSENKYWKQPKKDSLSVRVLATEEGEKVFANKFLK